MPGFRIAQMVEFGGYPIDFKIVRAFLMQGAGMLFAPRFIVLAPGGMQ
jgi:hypothetical protein